ncbi:MAG: hypothetical protein R3E31_22775 [Chloroflexota bacterium]
MTTQFFPNPYRRYQMWWRYGCQNYCQDGAIVDAVYADLRRVMAKTAVSITHSTTSLPF